MPHSRATAVSGLVAAARVDDVPAGAMKRVFIADRAIVLVNAAGTYFAIAARCTHRKAPLERGTLEGCTIICPWHKGTFDLRTGDALTPPVEQPIKTYPVSVADGMIHVSIEE